jgi:nucleoside phosphorylase
MPLKSLKKPFLIITAIPFETKAVLSHQTSVIIQKVKNLKLYELVDMGYLLEVGIGVKANNELVFSIINSVKPKLIINIGLCGALNSSIPIGRPFLINEIYQMEKGDAFRKIILPSLINLFPYKSILTSSEPILSDASRIEMYNQTLCDLVDMESFIIAQFCNHKNIPLIILKIVSDHANEKSVEQIKHNKSDLKLVLSDSIKQLLADFIQHD